VIGRLFEIVVDCPDPRELAAFYGALTGLPVTEDAADWVTLGDGTTGRLCFQLASDHVPPRWPDPAYPQQLHLDFQVADLDEADRQVRALGATYLATEDATCRVYADPAGHPFCLVVVTDG
jgi:hypothetical protein